eukprot:TRINITY_DN5775_c0_g1_i1.p1 TRINITY_DN5775_c0_g1~~TRINITY_DN5775_c0_g1_i1.p1  ORF type:complete len:1495 (+),score=287.07 TRINITY_DN5775_c0_g1_i1:1633-6117(+)
MVLDDGSPYDLRLDPQCEEALALLVRSHIEQQGQQPPQRREFQRLSNLYISLSKGGYRTQDIEACLSCPFVNTLAGAVEWLTIHVETQFLPPEVRGAGQADGGASTPSGWGPRTPSKIAAASARSPDASFRRPSADVAPSTPPAAVAGGVTAPPAAIGGIGTDSSDPSEDTAEKDKANSEAPNEVAKTGSSNGNNMTPVTPPLKPVVMDPPPSSLPATPASDPATAPEASEETTAAKCSSDRSEFAEWVRAMDAPPTNVEALRDAAAVKRALDQCKRIEKDYKLERRKAEIAKTQKGEPQKLAAIVRGLKGMEAQARRIVAGDAGKGGKAGVQCAILSQKNLDEVRQLVEVALAGLPDTPVVVAQGDAQSQSTGSQQAQSATVAAVQQSVGMTSGKRKPPAPLTAFEAAQASVDRTRDSRWSGKTPVEHLREWCRANNYGKPLFEAMQVQPGDEQLPQPVFRFRCVLTRTAPERKAAGVGAGVSREEFMDDQAFEDSNVAKEAVSTRALYVKVGTQRPLYRLLPPRYRDMWLAWMKQAEDDLYAEQALSDKERTSFITRLVQDSERSFGTAASEAPRKRSIPSSKPFEQEADIPDAWDEDAGNEWEASPISLPGRRRSDASPVGNGQDHYVSSGTGNASGAAGARDNGGNPNVEEEEILDSWEDLDESAGTPTSTIPSGKCKLTVEEQERETTNSQLLQELERRNRDPGRGSITEEQQQLPICGHRAHILDALLQNQVVVISGETGCGKTTQVPQFIVEDMIRRRRGAECNVVCTQPRRISAISVAQRVAQEMGGPDSLGGLVGYQVRLQRSLSRSTRVLFCTTGVLLRKLQSDPDLAGVSHVIVDEAHEMTVQSDFLLIILRDLLAARPNLRIVLMSATINAQRFAQYFGGCLTVTVEGRVYPVTDYFLEDAVQLTGWRAPLIQAASPTSGCNGGAAFAPGDPLPPQLARLTGVYSAETLDTVARLDPSRINYELIERLLYCMAEQGQLNGAVLIFLPGLMEIQALFDQLLSSPYGFGDPNRYVIITLHSMLAPTEQAQVFERPRRGAQKIVLATNVAETSITIPDVVAVVDTGRMKEVRFQPNSRMSCLVECWVSRANANQRRGRAGRVRAGRCYHLFPKHVYEEQMAEYQQPEILRVPLDDICLQIKVLGLGSCAEFLGKAIEPPSPLAVAQALQGLKEVGALDDAEGLTPLGYHLSSLPVDIHIGKLLIYGCLFRCLDSIATIAAFMSLRSPFIQSVTRRQEADQAYRSFMTEQSDHLSLLRVYRDWASRREASASREEMRQFCRENFLSQKTLFMVEQMKGQFSDHLADLGFLRRGIDVNANAQNTCIIKAVLSSGLYPNVVRGTASAGYGNGMKLMVQNEEVFIHPSSVNAALRSFPSPWFVFFEKIKTLQVFLRDCTNVKPICLVLFGAPNAAHGAPQLSEGAAPTLGYLTVGGGHKLVMPPRTAVLLKRFKELLQETLWTAIKHPAQALPALDQKVMRVAIQLVSS